MQTSYYKTRYRYRIVDGKKTYLLLKFIVHGIMESSKSLLISPVLSQELKREN